nr:hypothetical protein MFLOJ_43700 [Mycobacterium florentinum]
MPNDHNVIETGGIDIGDSGVHPIGDGDGCQIRRPATAAGQIDRQDPQFRCLTG